MRSFVKTKLSQNGDTILPLTGIGKSCSSREFFMSPICHFNAIRDNKILAKISEFRVPGYKMR